MKTPARTALAVALALAAAPAFAQTFSQTVFFGDSLTDSGYFRPALVQQAGPSAAILGKFTTNPGLVWSEYLADFYGDEAYAANQGGSNYAVGGARVGTDSSGALGPIPSIGTQVGSYLASTGGRADPNALYTVWGGANDLFAVTAGAPADVTIGTAITQQVGLVGTLQGAGARYVLVPTIPDLGVTPSFIAQGALAQAQGTQLSVAYNNALFSGLSAAGLRVIPLDTFNLLREVTGNPGAYGFSNVTGTACQPQITAQSVTCYPATYVSPDAADTYAFADGVHPTSAAHRIIADYAISVIEAPRVASLMPHAEETTGAMRAERVFAQLEGRPDSEGMRAWADVRGDYQKFDEDAGLMVDAEGNGPGLSAGLDWRSGSLVYGGFVGYGTQSLDFGSRFGEFSYDDTTLGGYLGWRGERAWVSGQLGYTWSSYEFDRKVELGPATRRHRSEADGSNLTVAVQAGYEFEHGALRHGPVASLVSQTIEIDEMVEDHPDMATSLAYAGQDLDTLVGSVGWQVEVEASASFRPYARLSWEHDFEEEEGAEAFARMQSLPNAAPYAVPGLEIDGDHGTVLLGARARFAGLEADFGVTGAVAREGSENLSAFVSVGKGF